MCPRDRLETTPRSGGHAWPSLIERLVRAQQPKGTIPESWVTGLRECVSSGYLDRPESVIPLESPSLLRELAPTAMKEPGDRGSVGFGVFVAWCSDLRQGAMRDFSEVGLRASTHAEVTMLARSLDVALVAPSWLSGCHRRVRQLLAEEVQGRLVSEVPELVSRVEALRTWTPDSHQMASWCDAMALAAVRQWQDEVLDEVEGMGAKSLLWYRVLNAWREARAVTGQPVPERMERWLETTQAPKGTGGTRVTMALEGWRSIRLIHGLRRSVDGCVLLKDNASEASEYHGAIGVAAALLDLGTRQVEGYWRRRKEQCQGWPLRQPIPFKLLVFANDPLPEKIVWSYPGLVDTFGLSSPVLR